MRLQIPRTLDAILAANPRDDRHITLIEGEKEQRVLSFQRLRQRALGMLGALQRRSMGAGDTMILCLGDNERFLEMFWACVLGGIVPVPLAPGTADEHRRKLLRVFSQIEGACVYIDGASLDRLDEFAAADGLVDEARRLRAAALIPGTLDFGDAPGQPVPRAPDDLAFVQYSSGSTGEPKGVLLTHRNLCANIASIIEAADFSERDVALSWMPLSHDMGLIGFHLNMLACGASHAIMRTELFARRPLLWLEQASEKRATVLCSPNFGYQHYLRQLATKPAQGLDLSAVRLIFNGAEPISAELCRQFAQTMAPHGLGANTMFPVYGLAEASLAVSFPKPGAPLQTVVLDRQALQVGAPARLLPAGSNDSADGVELVRLGRALPGSALRIVDGAGALLAEPSVGHVQIRGDNVSVGYRGDTPGSRATDGWLDTGDLGLQVEGDLVITGRVKDLVIVNGQNFYPADIERIAQQVEGIEPNRVAAAGVRAHGEDADALALFIVHRGDLAGFVPKAIEVRRIVSRQTGLDVSHLVPVGTMPRTTSGKLQRYALAQAFERNEFATILAELGGLLSSKDPAKTDDRAPESTVARLMDICRRLVPDRQITPDTDLLDIDLNSLTLARIHEAIEREYPQRIDVTDLFDYPTLGQLAELLDTPRA